MKISLLIPFYNEEKQIPLTLAVVTPILKATGFDFELVLVDDGSRDATWAVIQSASSNDHRIHGIHFSRNFGKESAICAALDASTGEPPTLWREHVAEGDYRAAAEEAGVPLEREPAEG